MKVWKKILAPVLAAAVMLVPAACGSGNDTDPGDVVGGDWRVTGIVRDSGTITRGGEDTDVLVCINADSADFYYDSEDQTLYGYASYPTTLPCDPWEAFRSIDFADRNGDGDSDAALLFEVDGNRVLLVWYWDGGSDAFVFQPEESQIGGDDNGATGEFLTDEDFDADISAWQGDDGSQLLLDLPNGCYTYRTWYGRVGTGSLVRDGNNLVLSFGDLTGENDYCLIREGRGFRPVLLSGQEGGAWAGLNGLHFGPAQGEAAAFDSSVLDGEGPFSPERSGSLPTGQLVKQCFSGKYTEGEMHRMLSGRGGLVAYTGSNDMRYLLAQAEHDKKIAGVVDAFHYQIGKEIGAMAAVMHGKVDQIILTGGIAYGKETVDAISEMVGWIAPITVYPGEDELLALAQGARRVLRGEEPALEYRRPRPDDNN